MHLTHARLNHRVSGGYKAPKEMESKYTPVAASASASAAPEVDSSSEEEFEEDPSPTATPLKGDYADDTDKSVAQAP